jgi:hypothetical protein
VWLQYLKPYQPPAGPPNVVERVRSLFCLAAGGASLGFAFAFLLCDMEWSLPFWLRMMAVGMAFGFVGLAGMVLFEIYPPRRSE